jgi:hypothetical protein
MELSLTYQFSGCVGIKSHRILKRGLSSSTPISGTGVKPNPPQVVLFLSYRKDNID